jgi:predicted ferric reductase
MMRPHTRGSLGSFGRNEGQHGVIASGMTRERRIKVASVGYAVIVLTPLFVVLVGPGRAERGFWVEFGVALGFIGLAMLGLQSVLTARFPRVSSSLGQDALLQFHRQAGIVAFAFVLAHPVILLLADGDNWEFLDPRVNFLRAAFLIIVLFALPAIIVTSLWREQLRLPYEWWRLGHGALAVLIVLIGLVHITRVQYYLSSLWKQALWLAIGSASIGCVLYVRALQPLRVRRRPYTVSSVEEVADRTWSVTVDPRRWRGVRLPSRAVRLPHHRRLALLARGAPVLAGIEPAPPRGHRVRRQGAG